MESDEGEAAAADMEAETVTVATTPSTKLLNQEVGGLGLNEQAKNSLVSKLIGYAKSHCSGSTYDVTKIVQQLKKHIGSDMSGRSKHHIIGSLRTAKSEISESGYSKSFNTCRNLTVVISFLEREPDNVFTQGEVDVARGGGGAAESHKNERMPSDTASGLNAPGRGGEPVDKDVDGRKPAAQILPSPSDETEEVQAEAAPALHGQGEHQAQADGAEQMYGMGEAREIGDGQICVPMSKWYYTLDALFNKSDRQRITQYIGGVVRRISPANVVLWTDLHVNSDNHHQLAEEFFRPHAKQFSHDYLAIAARNVRMPVATKIRALFKFMLGEENASLWMTPEAEKREEDDFAQQLANASAREAKKAASSPVNRQMERERRKPKRARDEDDN